MHRRVCSCAGVYVGCVEGSTKPDIYMGGVKLWFLVFSEEVNELKGCLCVCFSYVMLF